MKEGPSLAKSFRNIPGVDICHVDRLNLLSLAPGGSFGRFVIYTEGAAKRLGALFGTYKGGSAVKKGYTLPRAKMTNADISRIINSEEIQSVLAPRKAPLVATRQRKNPLKNKSVLGRLCPWAVTQKKIGALAHVKGSAVQKSMEKQKAKKAALKKKVAKASKEYFKTLESAYAVAPVVEEAAEEEEE
jgi:large subunit ribosomal protein L4e